MSLSVAIMVWFPKEILDALAKSVVIAFMLIFVRLHLLYQIPCNKLP